MGQMAEEIQVRLQGQAPSLSEDGPPAAVDFNGNPVDLSQMTERQRVLWLKAEALRRVQISLFREYSKVCNQVAEAAVRIFNDDSVVGAARVLAVAAAPPVFPQGVPPNFADWLVMTPRIQNSKDAYILDQSIAPNWASYINEAAAVLGFAKTMAGVPMMKPTSGPNGETLQ